MPTDATLAPRGVKAGPPAGRHRRQPETGGRLAKLDTMLFSLDGRATRLQYWLTKVAYIVGLQLMGLLLRALNEGTRDHGGAPSAPAALSVTLLALLMILIVWFMTAWANFAVNVKRWHDRDKSWTWALLGFVPIVGWIWQGIECGYLDGTLGPNRFGPSPKGTPGVVYESHRP